MTDVLRGLGHSHAQGIVHRDIKPANILIGNSREAKLPNFSLALPNLQGLDVSQLRQYQYMLRLAPEVRRIQDYTLLSDIYAAGVTLYRLVNGDSNLPQVSPADAHKMARKGEFPPRDGYRDFIPQGLKRMISKALNVNPKSRYQSADEMRYALEHQKILVDWTESRSASRTVWSGCDVQGRIYRVVMSENDKISIETKRGKTPNVLRRMSSLCYYDLKSRDADRKARRILQNFVSGKG